MNFNCTRLLATTALFAAACVATPVRAADLAPAPETGEWRFAVAPYVWASGIKGDVGVLGREPINIDVPFSDILDYLKFAGMGVVEAHNGEWGVFGDVIYTSLDVDKSLSRVVGGQGQAEVGLKANVDVDEFVTTLMGQWRAVDSDQMTLDLMAGARLWHVENDMSVRLKLNGNEVNEFSGSDGATWVDPMVGLKTRINTESPLYFTAWGLIGGAGVGSDLDWDVMGGVGYQWTDSFATVLGYRAVGVDYEDDGFVYDVIQQGFVLGGVFNF